MASKLPVISGKEAVKTFEKAGWKFVRIGSSRHMIMKKEGVIQHFPSLIIRYWIVDFYGL